MIKNAQKSMLPSLVDAQEVACWLRTSTKAVYAMAERGKLPGIVRIGRRLLFDANQLNSWLNEKRAVSEKE